jgi:hypothetical protein
MNFSLLNIFKNFNNLRYSTGIAMMFNGFPLIFFFRDTLGIGPASSVFTLGFFLLAFILMMPAHLFRRLYKPNVILFNMGLGFLLVSLYYFLFINHGGKSVTDIGNFIFIFGFMVLLLHIPNDVKDTLVVVFFLISLFSNVTLVYSLLTDPNWAPGMRAAVSFANGDAQPGGNPHMTARNGVICLISAVVIMQRVPSIFVKLFLFFSMLFSLAVVVLSLAKSSYLGIGLMVMFYFIFHFKFSRAFSAIGSFFSFRNVVLVLLAVLGIRYFLSLYGDVYGLLLGYWDNFENRILDVIYTSSGVRLSEKADIDYSAMGRVSGFGEFLKTFFSWDFFFGRGYKSVYLDIPILESFVAEGLPGFIFFASFNIFMFVYSIREIRTSTNSLTTFLAYFFVSMSVLLFTGGQPTEIAFWFPFMVFIRFLGIKYLDKPEPVQQLAVEPEPVTV